VTETKGRILAVDDDPEALGLLMGVLEEQGYRVQPADSGKLALVSVAAHPPELILLDVRMPGMDGFEICRRIRETEAGRRIPLMFISASVQKEEWAEGLALGAVDFISKPFHREELLARVRTHMELGRLQVQLETRVAQRTAELHRAVEQLRIEVAERRRSELAARESEARFRIIANAAPVIIWTSDRDNRVDFRNEYAQLFTGCSHEELADHRWAEVVHAEDREGQQLTYSQAMPARCRFQLEYRVRRADGEYRWMLDMGTPRFLPNGEFAGYVGIVTDLTDIKRSQERAFTAQNLENLRVLSAGIAHDFNTLIGAIFGEADLALSDMTPDAPSRGSVERIIGVAKRAADIVRLLIAYAGDRSDTAGPELIDLNSVVQEIVPHLKVRTLRQIEIRTSLADRLPAVLAKPLQIRQVVLNLVLNGVESLDGQKGLITVTTSPVQIGEGLHEGCENLPDGSYVMLSISDTGCGMSEKVQARIFDPYYSTKGLGRGLGLAAVHGIVRSCGGGISARSVPGGGSTLEVLLPNASQTPTDQLYSDLEG
jgi:PAS domain S-box-containing protein